MAPKITELLLQVATGSSKSIGHLRKGYSEGGGFIGTTPMESAPSLQTIPQSTSTSGRQFVAG